MGQLIGAKWNVLARTWQRHDSIGGAVWILPFTAFATMFLLLPALSLVTGSFIGTHGKFTWTNLMQLLQPQFLDAYRTTFELSAVTALAGGVVGLLLAWAVIAGGLPRVARPLLLTFSGVASNFAGIPLAFAFTAALGPAGIATALIHTEFHTNVYNHGFTLFSFPGLALTYLYFQIPLMVLLIAPSVDALQNWAEAAAVLGASPWHYWWSVGFPLMRLPLLGAMLLLFGNGFGAYATAYALTSGMINLVPILIGSELSGNVQFNPGLGDALAVGMVAVMAFTFGAYNLLRRLTEGRLP